MDQKLDDTIAEELKITLCILIHNVNTEYINNYFEMIQKLFR